MNRLVINKKNELNEINTSVLMADYSIKIKYSCDTAILLLPLI